MEFLNRAGMESLIAEFRSHRPPQPTTPRDAGGPVAFATAAVDDVPPNPILCYKSRSGIIESFHRGAACAVRVRESDGQSEIVHQSGNIHQVFYPRSAVKYVQILPLLESGAADHFGFTDEELAVMCASHLSEPMHVAVVRRILGKIGAQESDLACGGHQPGCEASMYGYLRDSALKAAGAEVCGECTSLAAPFEEHVFNNCSGKHAGFLALARFIGAPLAGYLEESHPVQRRVREAVSCVFGIPDEELRCGSDGCSAPAYRMRVYDAAVGFARICAEARENAPHNSPVSAARRAAIRRTVRCVTSHPLMVRGHHSFCSDLMAAGGGNVIGKLGAAGVYCAGAVKQGVGWAVKVDDGSLGPQFCVTLAFFRGIGAVTVGEEKEQDNGEAEARALRARMRGHAEPAELTCMKVASGVTFVNPALELFPRGASKSELL